MQEDFRLLLLADTTLDRKQLERLLSKYAPHICLYEQSFWEKIWMFLSMELLSIILSAPPAVCPCGSIFKNAIRTSL